MTADAKLLADEIEREDKSTFSEEEYGLIVEALRTFGLRREASSGPGEGVYVASRVKHAEMWKQYRAAGTPIIASWIDEAGEGETGDLGELWQRIRDEIRRSRGLVFYAAGVEDFPVKGALVEVGIALAMSKPVYVVLNDVMLDGRTLRPVGSWLLDRNVHRYEDLDDALIAASLGRRQYVGERKDRAHDSAYEAGAMFGWNCGVTGDRKKYDEALACRAAARRDISPRKP